MSGLTERDDVLICRACNLPQSDTETMCIRCGACTWMRVLAAWLQDEPLRLNYRQRLRLRLAIRMLKYYKFVA